MGCDQSNVRKQPATEAEKTKMTEPWAVDKFPKQYGFLYVESSWRWERITTIALAVCPRTSLSATVHTKEPSSTP